MNKTASKIVTLLLSLLMGVMVGVRWNALEYAMHLRGIDLSIFLCYVLFLPLFVIVCHLYSLLHLLGRLLGGLLTGYRMGCLQIRHFQFLRVNGRTIFRFRHGKRLEYGCNLFPPESNEDGRFPFFLYWLGGTLLCLLLSIALMVLSSSLFNHHVVSTVLYVFSVTGLIYAMLTGIPMTNKYGSCNSGFIALQLAQDEQSLHADWIRMKIFEAICHGRPLQQMPDEWFSVPLREEMENQQVAHLALSAVDRMILNGQYDDAAHLAEELDCFGNVPPSLRDYLAYQRFFLELVVGENRPEELSRLLTVKQESYLKKPVGNDFHHLIPRYAYMLLHEHDEAKAQSVKAAFEKYALDNLFPSDVQDDRAMMALVDRAAAERGQKTLS